MKIYLPDSKQAGGALMLTMIMSGVALAVLAGAMTWSANSTRTTHRAIQYAASVAAAEAATEKVISRISRDFFWGGESLVTYNLADYRRTVPTAQDSPFWDKWEFNDGTGSTGQTFVQLQNANKYIVLNSTYAGLRGYVTTYSVVAHARQTPSPQRVVAGVLQDVQLARIPIFQFAMYSSGDMEISCGQDFNVTGRVHANGQLYVEPDRLLTFESSVTAVQDILFKRHPLDTRGDPAGGVVYVHPDQKVAHVPAMSLPIGTNNTSQAVREIIEPPPFGEPSDSPVGRLRYYNQADLVITVTNAGNSMTSFVVTATSGIAVDNSATLIPTNELATFVATTNKFWDGREEKTVRPIDINIANLKSWSEKNSNLRNALGNKDVSSVYVLDRRKLPGTNLPAVRVLNGLKLPSRGLTVATAKPLYVQGNFNQTNSANVGTTNTITTQPASLVADAITILSTAWTDKSTGPGKSPPGAASTTVNAALLTGVVETTKGKYSGGMENFPRFLENWGSANVFTYNGSMVKMFASRHATNSWGKNNVYAPPKRNWAYDLNFEDSAKLPPLTPGLQKVLRSQWNTVAENNNSAP